MYFSGYVYIRAACVWGLTRMLLRTHAHGQKQALYHTFVRVSVCWVDESPEKRWTGNPFLSKIPHSGRVNCIISAFLPLVHLLIVRCIFNTLFVCVLLADDYTEALASRQNKQFLLLFLGGTSGFVAGYLLGLIAIAVLIPLVLCVWVAERITARAFDNWLESLTEQKNRAPQLVSKRISLTYSWDDSLCSHDRWLRVACQYESAWARQLLYREMTTPTLSIGRLSEENLFFANKHCHFQARLAIVVCQQKVFLLTQDLLFVNRNCFLLAENIAASNGKTALRRLVNRYTSLTCPSNLISWNFYKLWSIDSNSECAWTCFRRGSNLPPGFG